MRPSSAAPLMLLGCAVLLAGCDVSMTRQRKLTTYAPSGLWRDGTSARPLPEGVVAQGDVERAAAATTPPPVTDALLNRGRERFGIFCAPCHGLAGDGDGVIVHHGFPAPPSYHIDRLLAAPGQHFYDVISNGYGVMFSYGDRSLYPRAATVAACSCRRRPRRCGASAMRRGRTRIALFAGAAAAAACLIADGVFDPRSAASGWLVGFVFCAQIVIGSLSLLMIHRLTSGRWGEAIAPVVAPSCVATPMLALFAIPLFIAIPQLYSWAQHPEAVKADVLAVYLNRPAFILRSAVALGGWTALALVLPRTSGWRGQLLAALGLVFHAVAISSVSIDWYLSREAPFTSSSFGASVAISSLAAALAWAVAWAPTAEGDPAIGDLGGLLLASVLGLTYIDFMAVLVIWYGDLPREETWFVTRGRLPWTVLAWSAFLLGSVIPVVTLIQAKFRNDRHRLRIVGVTTLAGLAVYDAYLVAPPSGTAALLPSFLAIFAIGLVLIGLLLPAAARRSPSSISQEHVGVR